MTDFELLELKPIVNSNPKEKKIYHEATPSGVTNPKDPLTVSNNDVLKNLADLLTQRQGRDSLPRPEPEIFNGDHLQFPNWLKSFETFIEKKTEDPSERLYYLSRYTSGDAKEAVSGLLALNTAEVYNKAKGILVNRFGNAFLVSDAYRRKINDWPKIPANDGPALRKFSDFLENCNTAMTSIHYLSVLNDPDENQKMLKKLPAYLVARWSRIVDEALAKEHDGFGLASSKTLESATLSRFPSFSEFCKFLRQEAHIACNPVTSICALKITDQRQNTGGRKPPGLDSRTFASGSDEVDKLPQGGKTSENEQRNEDKGTKDEDKRLKQDPKMNKCIYCKESHELDSCSKFKDIKLSERKTFIKTKGLCWGCLRWGHIRKNCKRRKTCTECKRVHPTCLHEYEVTQENSKKDNPDTQISNRVEVCNTRTIDGSETHSLIVPVWLYHENNAKKRRMVYALLDSQSDACFVKESTVQALGVDGPDVNLKLSTVLAEEMVTCQRISGLVVRGVNEEAEINLPRTYTRTAIPAKRGQIPRRETAEQWNHLNAIATKMIPYQRNVEVGLLIGLSCTKAIKPKEVIPGSEDEPYAVRTVLGWGVIGVVDKNSGVYEENSNISVNRTIANEVKPQDQGRFRLALNTQVKEVLSPQQINRMMEQDFNECKSDGPAMSHEDRVFLKKVSNGIKKQDDGHYEIPLPLREKDTKLPNNKRCVLRRLLKLKIKLKRNEQFRSDYTAFMKDIIDRGYAERVPPSESKKDDGRVWYIPHHGIYHPRKNKIRVVFDCRAEFNGESLNRHLLSGPDMTNNLVDVLCRFRQEPIGLMCDIEAMFHQVRVSPDCRDFLRFFWWKDGNLDNDPLEFRMTVHLFGAVSSPGCCNFALKQAADDHRPEKGSEAANFVRNNFYVHDGLQSVSSTDAAISLIESTKGLCKSGGFTLHKFVSNSKEVIAAIPPKERAGSIQDLDLNQKALPIERALGVQWCVLSDTLQFRIELKDCPLTRRGILSTVSSIFDPLGMLAPVTLRAKEILQELCRIDLSWDDEIPDHIRMKWLKWRSKIHLLSELKIPRCYKPESFGNVR